MYTKVEKADYGVDAFSITTQDDWHYKFHNKFEFESETHENVILTSQGPFYTAYLLLHD